jgi:5-methylcytosine-specific restriction enzyme A
MNFVPGTVYRRRQDIHEVFGGQRQSGISTPSEHSLIFIFKGDQGAAYGYTDEFKPDGTFWYTGEGQTGDMEMVRGNKAIRDHQQEGNTIHLFEYVNPGRVQYVGQANYLGHHFEDRPDVAGNQRKAIIFELDVDNSTGREPVQQDTIGSPASKKRTLKLWSRPLDEVRRMATTRAKSDAKPQERRAIVRLRSESVRVYVLRRSDGICECCGTKAPFITRKGRPYLEPHHTRRLSDGGPDDPKWVAAVCPNCHREVHYGDKGDALNQELKDKITAIES